MKNIANNTNIKNIEIMENNRPYEFPVRILGLFTKDHQTINQEPEQFLANVENIKEYLALHFPFASYPTGRVTVAVAKVNPKTGKYTSATIYKNGLMNTDKEDETTKFFNLREA